MQQERDRRNRRPAHPQPDEMAPCPRRSTSARAFRRSRHCRQAFGFGLLPALDAARALLRRAGARSASAQRARARARACRTMRELFGSATYVRVFFNTFLVAGVVTAVTLAHRLPGRLAARHHAAGRWSSILFGIISCRCGPTCSPAPTPGWCCCSAPGSSTSADGIGLIDEPLPLVNNLVGVTIGMTYIMLPFMILPLHAHLASHRPRHLAGRVPLRRRAAGRPSAACSCRCRCPASPPAA